MPKQEESSLNLITNNWPVLAAFVVAFVGLAVIRPKLESPRPTPAAPEPPPSRLDNTVQARLWQDPLTGFIGNDQIRHLKNVPLSKVITDMPPKRSAAEDSKPVAGSKEVLFLFVYVDGRSDAATAESRRRERYAALSALNSAGYVPLASDRLSYVTTFDSKQEGQVLPVSTDKNNTAADGGTEKEFVIPYEWVRPDESEGQQDAAPKYDAVCLMWIRDNLVRKTIEFFGCLQMKLTEAIPSSAGQVRVQFAVTGRINSTQLLDFSRQSKKLQDEEKRFLPVLGSSTVGLVGSPLAQGPFAAASAVIPATAEKREEYARLADIPFYITVSTSPRVREKIRPDCGLQLQFLIGTDEMLADCLVKELRNRGARPGDPGNYVAIVAEWDTDYGRNMVPVFKEAIGCINHTADVDNCVCCYSYLAGLDGKLPGEAKPSEAGEPKPDGNATAKAAAPDLPTADKGEGDSQVDYLRRLVDRMKSEQKTFRAIGVVGNDVYDKLLILKALRPNFPEAVFFTTDLDARLLQPAELPSTHNLVIASHYGLTLKEGLQKTIPPFRSSYDTASYLGYLKVLQFEGIEDVLFSQAMPGKTYATAFWKRRNGQSGQSCTEVIPPRLFEVARHDAYELFFCPDDPLYGPTPRQDIWFSLEKLLNLGLSLLVLASLLWLFSKPWRYFLTYPHQRLKLLLFSAATQNGENSAQTEDSQRQSHLSLVLWVGLGLALIMACLMYYAHQHVDEEPVLWFAGISVWPAVLLRLLACVLCFGFVVHVFERVRKSNDGIENEINPVPKKDTAVPREDWRTRVKAAVGEAMQMWSWSPEGSIDAVWTQFKEHGKTTHRIVRCLLLSVLYGLLIMLLYLLFPGTMLQARGPVTGWVFISLFFLSEAGLIFLLVFVVDCTFLCYRFVTYLESAAEKQWPPEAFKRLATEKGFTDAQAAEQQDALKQCLLIRLVDLATKDVAKFLYAPFTVLLVLVIAQSPLFENWHWNIPIILTTLLNAIVALCCAWMLQRTAKHAKQNALDALDKLIVPKIGNREDGAYAKLRRIRADIAGLQSGAFGGFHQNPAVKALLIPLGGGGGLAALEGLVTYLRM